ncbi:hypothetical protein F4825DRAFT_458561 [Nemania diffusa]|nr:hypothetical protein F4825DRAFT_458561 [Nemania diffusa]
METIERQLPFNAVEDPKNFSLHLEMFCQQNGFEIESLELRNDILNNRHHIIESIGFPKSTGHQSIEGNL